MIAGMKRFLSVAAALLVLLFAAPSGRAHAAEGGYAVAAARDVWFYAREDESSRLFQLPFSYYVRVLAEGETYCSVEYLDDVPPYRKIQGYCRKDALTPVDFVPARPYLRREITVEYSLPQKGGLGEGKFLTVERTFVYYGQRYEGSALYFYVLADGEFDYIPAASPLEYEYNTDYLETAAVTSHEGSAGLSAAEIAIICIACVAVVGVAVLVLRGKKPLPEGERAEF